MFVYLQTIILSYYVLTLNFFMIGIALISNIHWLLIVFVIALLMLFSTIIWNYLCSLFEYAKQDKLCYFYCLSACLLMSFAGIFSTLIFGLYAILFLMICILIINLFSLYKIRINTQEIL